jgi:uridine kinase
VADFGPTIVGIAGGSGAGKTTFVRRLVDKLPPGPTTILSHDAYYRDLAHRTPDERATTNFDHPDSLDTRLLCDHIDSLRRGRGVDVPTYDFTTHARTSRTTRAEPTPTLIVEGILILADEALRSLFDLAVYIDVEPDARLARRMERDIRDRGRSAESVIRQWRETVQPMYNEFVRPSRAFADVIVPHGGDNRMAARMVAAFVRGDAPRPDSAAPASRPT